MTGRSWAGGALWRDEGNVVLGRRAPAELHLNDEGGLLRSDTGLLGARADIRFLWSEVEKAERVRYMGIPFLGEAVRFTLKRTPKRNSSRVFGFGGMMRKKTTLEILDLAESKGVRVAREGQIGFTQP